MTDLQAKRKTLRKLMAIPEYSVRKHFRDHFSEIGARMISVHAVIADGEIIGCGATEKDAWFSANKAILTGWYET